MSLLQRKHLVIVTVTFKKILCRYVYKNSSCSQQITLLSLLKESFDRMITVKEKDNCKSQFKSVENDC